MNFPGPCAVFFVAGDAAGGFGCELQEDIDADGIVGAADEADAAVAHTRLNLEQLLRPAGGADDGVDLQSGEARDVVRRGGGGGKIHGDVHAGEIVTGDAAGVVIVGAIQALCDGETVFGRQLLDEAAHFTVSDDGQVHGRGASAARVRSCATIFL